uniref:Uncharacterized protein n=1 Tax=Anolis carolinensis TaxID=28377 RepID=A0A803SML9_ANOCA
MLAYFICGPRQFFFLCGPGMPKGWMPLFRAMLLRLFDSEVGLQVISRRE